MEEDPVSITNKTDITVKIVTQSFDGPNPPQQLKPGKDMDYMFIADANAVTALDLEDRLLASITVGPSGFVPLALVKTDTGDYEFKFEGGPT